jgi:formylglycine-generating enzyme required for sulfatase activity
MEMRFVPGGEFLMGSPVEERGRLFNEGPARQVRISRAFHIAATETTVAQFHAFGEDTGYVSEAERDAEGGFGIDFDTAQVLQKNGITWREPGFPGHRQRWAHPVALITWSDAEAFCKWLSGEEGRTYRLPTEAEWEYASRGGSAGRFWFGGDANALAAAANVADVSLASAMPAAQWAERWDDGYAFTAPVGSFAANPLGLHDIHGNVWEWCQDWFDESHYASAGNRDPAGPEAGRFRAIRDGGWFNAAAQNRSAQRVYFDPTFRYCLLSGFRVVMEAAN